MVAPRERRGWTAFAAMAGLIAGVALQLQQPVLWSEPVYAALVTAALACGLAWRIRWRLRPVGRRGLAALLLIGLAFGAGFTGWRAAVFAAQALDPTLEGRDLQVIGVVAQMPQRDEGGTRFRFDVESAREAEPAGGTVQLPPRLALGWYAEGTGLWARPASAPEAAPRRPEPLHAGERWQLSVRLKAPHGNLNPKGFDQELQLWEQGVQATGYVRAGAQDAPPVRLAVTWRHPVERAREAVRDAAFARIADRRTAGVIAALVTGDQSAIDRVDWDIYRATGVAHLVSISGLHITMCEPF